MHRAVSHNQYFFRDDRLCNLHLQAVQQLVHVIWQEEISSTGLLNICLPQIYLNVVASSNTELQSTPTHVKESSSISVLVPTDYAKPVKEMPSVIIIQVPCHSKVIGSIKEFRLARLFTSLCAEKRVQPPASVERSHCDIPALTSVGRRAAMHQILSVQ